MRRVLSSCLALLTVATFQLAEAKIIYTVTPVPTENKLQIKIEIPDTSKGVELQIPNWAPGSYRLVDNFRNVKNLTAKSANGSLLTIEPVPRELKLEYGDGATKNTATNLVTTWKAAPSSRTIVEYEVASNQSVGSMHWSGPSTYIYAVGRIKEDCELIINNPYKSRAYTGMDEIGRSGNHFKAPDYDVLADNPVSIGDLLVDTYLTRGKPHYIVMRGAAKADVDRTYLIKACKFVSDMQTDFFSGAPYNHYVWHFNVNDSADGAGGLEHLSSTQISLASGVGPGAVSVISHEFFHLWNVKRIRSAVLGPFDYTQLPKTGALWWLEGVTDYYAHQLLYRYGWNSAEDFYADASGNVTQIRRSGGLLEVSPYESSFRVNEASNGRGNSNGYRISYYTLGWVCAMLLDIELLSHSNGKHRLDDVLFALWRQCEKDKPGFAEGDIRKLLIQYGGDGMGQVYDEIIMTKGDKKIEDIFAKAGLRLSSKRVPSVDFGFTATPSAERNGLMVSRVATADSQIKQGDRIIKMGNIDTTGTRRAMTQALAKVRQDAKPDQPLAITLEREGQTINITVTPTFTSRVQPTVEPIAYKSYEQALTFARLMQQRSIP